MFKALAPEIGSNLRRQVKGVKITDTHGRSVSCIGNTCKQRVLNYEWKNN